MFGCAKNQPNYCADVQSHDRLKSTTSFRVTATQTVLTITDFLEAPRDQLSLDQRSDQQLDQPQERRDQSQAQLDQSKELLDQQLDQSTELLDQSQAQLDQSKELLDQQLDRSTDLILVYL